MIKITFPDSWDWDGPVASLVDVHSRGIDSSWMVKRAAAGVFQEFEDLKPKPGHSLIHLIAMGDADRYGGNRNGDWFYKTARRLELVEPMWDKVFLPRLTEKMADKTGRYEKQYHYRSPETWTDQIHTGNVERVHTFEKFAHVFRHHKNKPFPHKDDKGRMCPADPVYGSVKKAAHNPDMSRVELMIEVSDKDWSLQLDKLANGQDIPFSMAAKVPWDVCLHCGHKAKTPEHYCDHVAGGMNALLKSGHVVGVGNDYMTYFDISEVDRPADRIAWSLVKAAADTHLLAADLALDPKYAAYPGIEVLAEHAPAKARARFDLLGKAAAIEKQIPALAKASPITKGMNRPSEAVNQKLAALRGSHSLQNLPAAFRALADAGICLPLEKWAVLVFGAEKAASLSSELAAARTVLPGIFARQATDGFAASNFAYDPDDAVAPGYMRKLAADIAPETGVLPDQVHTRAVNNVLCGVRPEEQMKLASSDDHPLAREYAAYKLAFLDHVRKTRPADLGFVIEACVLQDVL